MQSSNALLGMVLLLVLALLLTLALHRALTILQNKSLVHHTLEVLKVPGFQSVGETIIQPIHKTFLLLLISVYLVGSITR
jgi:hypothetical protein